MARNSRGPGARGDLAGVDRSEYRDARDIINHLSRDVLPK